VVTPNGEKPQPQPPPAGLIMIRTTPERWWLNLEDCDLHRAIEVLHAAAAVLETAHEAEHRSKEVPT
jgi:hypothetical protein